jgi:pyruvate dehydrogenase E1 component
LREFGGLQSYPSRSKDPDPVDYSTGPVGIGATAPIWGAIARRYVAGLEAGPGSAAAAPGRQYSLVGDAELDEGAVWEAVMDPAVAELGEITWIVDLNRQSLDRVVPNIAAGKLQGMFAAAGWQVLTLKYGQLLAELFARRGGEALRRRIDEMTNSEYQRLLRCSPAELRERLPAGSGELRELTGGLDDATRLAAALGADPDDPWARFPAGSEEARLCEAAAGRLRRQAGAGESPPSVPDDLGRTPSGVMTTQAALGRALLDLTREAPAAARRVVTVSPDVSLSTNLAGWVNKVGVWSAADRTDWFADDAETIVHWREKPGGQHIELGIAETNLAGLLGELGATWSRWGSPLLPVGVLYDPFVRRALEPWSFGIYAGGQSILVGTPSGVSLAPEGGAHQSVITPSIGLEQPGIVAYEPTFAVDTERTLLASLSRLGRPDGSSAYLWLSTRPVDQTLARVPRVPGGAAGHRPRRAPAHAGVPRLCAAGAVREPGRDVVRPVRALEDVYRYHGIDADSIVRAALDAAG